MTLDLDRIRQLANDPEADLPDITMNQARNTAALLESAPPERVRRTTVIPDIRNAAIDATGPLQEHAREAVWELFEQMYPGLTPNPIDVQQIASELLANAADFIHFDDSSGE